MDDMYNPGEEDEGGGGKPGDPAAESENKVDAQTDAVSKEIFGGEVPEVGSEVKFRVEHIYEDQVELAYVKSGKDDNVNKPKSPNMDAAAEKLGSMGTMGAE